MPDSETTVQSSPADTYDVGVDNEREGDGEGVALHKHTIAVSHNGIAARQKEREEALLPRVISRERLQTTGEEIANTISHGLMAAGALVFAPNLLSHAAEHGDTVTVVGTAVFVASMFILYLGSTIYHAVPTRCTALKAWFRLVDHTVIYLLIAGTYTPFILEVLDDPWRWPFLVAEWGLAVGGILFKLCGDSHAHPQASTGFYLVMGWIGILAAKPLLAVMPIPGIIWLVAGGLSYSLGVIFYATDHVVPFGHLLWHFFVMGGT
ncbi:Hly-III related protein [Kipferlia bialata]|uniref:Hly-III related protein n=1 Tax=Kipferlia bialata TaxID=797122 RepID=A0A9K3CUN8_9EUKA|nr:Hly-III related protein [Kipferlia bialata]|eukprot:g3572.t1